MTRLWVPDRKSIAMSDSYLGNSAITDYGSYVAGVPVGMSEMTIIAYFVGVNTTGTTPLQYLLTYCSSSAIGLRIASDSTGTSTWGLWALNNAAVQFLGIHCLINGGSDSGGHGKWNHIAFVMNGASGVDATCGQTYWSYGGVPFTSAMGSTSGSAQTPLNWDDKNLTIGNRISSTSRYCNTPVGYVAWWDRQLSYQELELVRLKGPLSVRHGLALCHSAGRDWGRNLLLPKTHAPTTLGPTPENPVLG